MIRPAGRMLLGAIAGTIGVAVILFAVLVWRLAQGPVSLAFLTPYLTDALSFAESGFSAEVDDTILAWDSHDRTLDIRAVGVRVRDRSGHVVAAVPDISVGLSGIALLEGRIAPTSIDITGIALRLTRGSDGRLDFGLGPPVAAEPEIVEATDESNTELIVSVLQELSKPVGRPGPFGRITRVSIVDADIAVDDRVSKTHWRAPRSDLVLLREPGGVRGDLIVNLLLGEQIAKLGAEARFDGINQTVAVKFGFQNIEPARFAAAADALARLSALRMALTGHVSFTIDRERRLSEVAFAVAADGGVIDAADFYPQPLTVRSAMARGRMIEGIDKLALDEAKLDLDGVVLDLRGRVDFAPELALDIEGGLRDLPTDRLASLWPEGIAVNARAWIGENLRHGAVDRAKFRARIDAATLKSGDIPAEAATLDFEFAGVSATYFPPLTPLTEARGTARLDAQKLVLNLTDGRVGQLRVSDGILVVAGLANEKQNAVIDLTISGAIAPALALLDRKPLGFVARLGLKPDEVAGMAVTHAHFVVPLNDTRFDDIEFRASSDLRQTAIPKVFERFAIADGVMNLKVDGTGLDMTGRAAINGVPTNIAWRQEFDLRRPVAARYVLRGTADDAGRNALGYPTGDYLTGPVGADLAIESDGQGKMTLVGRFDLADAAMAIDEIGWNKAKGTAGELNLSLLAEPNRPTRLDRIAIAASDLRAKGEAVLRSGGLQSLDISELRHAGADVKGSVRYRAADDSYAIVVDGQALDLRAQLKQAFDDAPSPDRSRPTFNVALRLDKARINDDTELLGLVANVDIAKGRIAKLIGSGGFDSGGQIDIAIGPGTPRRQITIKSNNAAAVLRHFGIGRVQGGKFDLAAAFADDLPQAPLIGEAKLADFKVIDAPILAKLLTVGSPSGLGDLLSGEGITFTTADVPFSMTSTTLTIGRARAIGPGLGIIAEGSVNRREETLNLTGTIIPAYTLNNLLGNLPVIGNILVGREGEGILGLTYRATGAASDPSVTVNPLSVLAPGILRRLFVAPDASSPAEGKVGDPGERATGK